MVDKAISHACQVADGYLAGRYALPLQSVPTLLNTWCGDIARYWLHKRRINASEMPKTLQTTLCQTNKDFAKFGGDEATRAGFTLPDAAHIWTRYKAGLAYVVNVCDPARHKTVVTNEVLTVDAGTLTAKTRKPAIQRGYTVKDGQTVLNANQYTINTLTGEITFNARPTAPTISYTYRASRVTPACTVAVKSSPLTCKIAFI